MAVVAPSIGLGALQFSKELEAKNGLKSRHTMAAVPLTVSANRQCHAFPLFTNFCNSKGGTHIHSLHASIHVLYTCLC
ncbi:hypothetical protein HOLleu_29683 [Holothuria leucospilota]|uniref:Uncharacterized protein n=1 Tax=Holothuria leucospilota TaxID=206669 RepID=A0A9Q1GZI1_HOLLE|nr:hypothetical protein HOLleu_29683 [Holothuria leucospilota]